MTAKLRRGSAAQASRPDDRPVTAEDVARVRADFQIENAVEQGPTPEAMTELLERGVVRRHYARHLYLPIPS